LQREFNFHPLAIEDAVRDHERPKIERHTSSYLLVFYAASYNGTNGGSLGTGDANGGDDAGREPQIDLRQLSIFVGKNFIVTIRRQPIPQVAETMARWRLPLMPLGNSVSGVLYGLLDPRRCWDGFALSNPPWQQGRGETRFPHSYFSRPCNACTPSR
jgi:magnesium transporter